MFDRAEAKLVSQTSAVRSRGRTYRARSDHSLAGTENHNPKTQAKNFTLPIRLLISPAPEIIIANGRAMFVLIRSRRQDARDFTI
jgi:hypothetical protein